MQDIKTPVILWFRRDLRLADHPALTAACADGRPVIPLFIRDPETDALGAAPKWRLGEAVASLQTRLEARGSRLILRHGKALDCLRAVIADTGAGAVYWTRCYDPDAVARDTEAKAALKADGIDAQSFAGHLLFEPWTVETGEGGYYRVYSPFWKAVRDREVDGTRPEPGTIAAPGVWPSSDRLADWAMGAAMQRGAAIVARHACVGEGAAADRLAAFVADRIGDYKARRDFPGEDATSNLSENLAWGEISPHRLLACRRARDGARRGRGRTFPQGTRLARIRLSPDPPHAPDHVPTTGARNGTPFPGRTDPDAPEVQAWMQGRTGIPFVDAAMREMYVTGRMHNRGRMIVASYLTKHLMTHWQIGMDWFADCLIDWDPASNAMGWQWSAGSGPDADALFPGVQPGHAA
jgi:deoxyribodipyrimidine photo-lyase